MDLGLRGNAYIVSGGTAGLGLASARTLVAEGARVVVAGRRPSAVDAAVASLGAEDAAGVACDLADDSSAALLVDMALSSFGRLDGAVVSVGGPPLGRVDTVSDQEWRDGFNSAFLGTLRLCRAVADDLRRRGVPGAIALVLSTSVRSPVDGLDTSNGLRPGLAMLTKSMADQWGPHGIRVVSLLPGRILTDRLEALEAQSDDPAATRTGYESMIPLRRYGDPAEFGRVAAFAVSPAASYVTGSTLTIDGGLARGL
jgi:3-oxoacyl-[acyl-carrier protein] reductase